MTKKGRQFFSRQKIGVTVAAPGIPTLVTPLQDWKAK